MKVKDVKNTEKLPKSNGGGGKTCAEGRRTEESDSFHGQGSRRVPCFFLTNTVQKTNKKKKKKTKRKKKRNQKKTPPNKQKKKKEKKKKNKASHTLSHSRKRREGHDHYRSTLFLLYDASKRQALIF